MVQIIECCPYGIELVCTYTCHKTYVEQSAVTYPAFKVAVTFYQPVVAVKPAGAGVLAYSAFEIQVHKIGTTHLKTNTPLCLKPGMSRNSPLSRALLSFSSICKYSLLHP